MSNDRARTPSPHKPARVEPGVFSSLTSFQYYRAGAEDRKGATQGKVRSPVPVRSKSPVKTQVAVSPVRAKKAQAVPRTPERTYSPGLTRATTAQVEAIRSPEELLRLQESVKKLTAQLVKERKSGQALEQRLAEEESIHKQEQSKLRNDLLSIQQTVQKWKSQQHDKLNSELSTLKSALDSSRLHIKGLVNVFVGVLEQLVVRDFYADELMIDPMEEERWSALEGVQKLLVGRLEVVAAGTGTDLESEIASVRSWAPKPTYQLPKQMPLSKQAALRPGPDSFAVDPEDDHKPFPQISYSVEFFNEEIEAERESDTLHPLNPLRALDENRAKTSQTDQRTPEMDQLKLRIMNRIKGRSEEPSPPSPPSPDIAIAIYDFEGERVNST